MAIDVRLDIDPKFRAALRQGLSGPVRATVEDIMLLVAGQAREYVPVITHTLQRSIQTEFYGENARVVVRGAVRQESGGGAEIRRPGEVRLLQESEGRRPRRRAGNLDARPARSHAPPVSA